MLHSNITNKMGKYKYSYLCLAEFLVVYYGRIINCHTDRNYMRYTKLCLVGIKCVPPSSNQLHSLFGLRHLVLLSK